MAGSLRERPFDNFRVAITDPDFFVGRSQILELLRRSPFEVRVLLGGRRLGKTGNRRLAVHFERNIADFFNK
jgi:AAA+ ATPase superfamily predicted ATPase